VTVWEDSIAFSLSLFLFLFLFLGLNCIYMYVFIYIYWSVEVGLVAFQSSQEVVVVLGGLRERKRENGWLDFSKEVLGFFFFFLKWGLGG
jgi:hypothetical protein